MGEVEIDTGYSIDRKGENPIGAVIDSRKEEKRDKDKEDKPGIQRGPEPGLEIHKMPGRSKKIKRDLPN